MTTTMTPPSAEAIAALAETVHGVVCARDHAEYATEVAGYNSAGTYAPEIVVGAADEHDVQAAVRFAAEHGLTVTVQATGHGNYAPVRDGLLITTTRMQSIELDPDARSVTVGAGVQWQAITPYLEPHGFVAVSGSSPSVSAVGLALGGGLGPLSRTLGCTVDYVEAFRLVDATGEVRVVDHATDEELFWALRGGKVGFGVVTEMRLRLVHLPVLYAGSLYWDGEFIEPVYRAWVDWTRSVPDAVNSSVNIIRFPDADGPPPALRGRTVIHLRYAYASPGATDDSIEAEGEAHLATFRAIGTPLLDTIGRLPGTETSGIHSDPPGQLDVWEHGLFLDEIDQDYVTALLDVVGNGRDAPFIAVETRHFGGAVATKHDESAMGGRDARYSLFLIGAPVRELFAEVLPGLAARIVGAIDQYRHHYTNYHWSGHPTGEAFRRLWTAKQHERLDRVRAAIDPGGMFAFAQTPPPDQPLNTLTDAADGARAS
ncbi:FAD-linked oxidase [Pseudoclavibacter endophyticus]|uniref:FAD-binding oxidoreductase n=1 Tax=Pseudoclavibacter endophyticus TaxID=1778590 RepID=A0A6H9WN98_9MICO|nr:FAD-binding oxidoreductase [Pseudoclavibacter endophyticus]KAB1649181.1 FAD-binding oxidoreductase [Pseudoclavibacter endophyticus]GGA64800.1 FAD-linked oxidase [Pseudoclavibacter endophyticus]